MVIKFPGWRYHPVLGKRLIGSEAEEADLGPGWADSPAPRAEVREPVIVREAELPDDPKKPTKKTGPK